MAGVLRLPLVLAFLVVVSALVFLAWPRGGGGVEWVVVEELNRARLEAGAPPLSLVDYGFAGFRARDMVSRGYFGHCDPGGRLYLEFYSRFGVYYYVEESIGIAYLDRWGGAGDEEVALGLLHAMLYRDEAYGWAHRDSLLDPSSNLVEVAYASNGRVAVLVLEVYKAWVEWLVEPSYEGGVLEASGRLTLEGSGFVGVGVYRAYSPPAIAWPPGGGGVVVTCRRPPEGELVAWLLANGTGSGVDGVVEASGDRFRVWLSYSLPEGDDYVYYVVFWARSPWGEGRYGGEIPVALVVLGRGGG